MCVCVCVCVCVGVDVGVCVGVGVGVWEREREKDFWFEPIQSDIMIVKLVKKSDIYKEPNLMKLLRRIFLFEMCTEAVKH